ncbi:hypothetical protein ACQCVE_11905 [Metabacillus sp. 113a]|uniref:hypothetical protein n=1 Tax=Metabacillus sp. 113a TaxID=3404706 RepID=UPI003CF6F256
MKKVISILLTGLVLAGTSWTISFYAGGEAADYAFFVGLLGFALIYFFSSSGGAFSNTVDVALQSATGTKMEHQKHKFQISYALIAAGIFTLFALLIMLVKYAEYF